MDKFDIFADTLVKELSEQYGQCEDSAATPSSILAAVLNATAAARCAAKLFEEFGE